MKNKINGRNKGASGEREAADWLKAHFKLEVKPQRNLEQVRSGGHDIEGFPPFAFEVKRCETLSLKNWWVQVVNSLTEEYCVPVVMYRQNRKPWKFLISATAIGLPKGYILLEAREFIGWANLYLDKISNQES